MSNAPIEPLSPPQQSLQPPVEAASTGSQDASGKPVVLVSLLVSLMVTSMCILAYDRFVRVPSTPRLGTVDVGEIFAANQAKTLKTVIATKAQVDPNGAQPTSTSPTSSSPTKPRIWRLTPTCMV